MDMDLMVVGDGGRWSDGKNLSKIFTGWGISSSEFFVSMISTYRQCSEKGSKERQLCDPNSLYF